jgi:hypothetical protein
MAALSLLALPLLAFTSLPPGAPRQEPAPGLRRAGE